MSEHQLLQHWPLPVIVCDVAKFVGFMQFYLQFIPNFEIRITPLHDILREDYSSTIRDLWTPVAKSTFDQMRNAIVDDPCFRWYDHCKLLVLRTNFSAKGFGYDTCQPMDNDTSLNAMHKCMQGGSFDFMTKDSTTLLHLVAFGCHRTRGNKKHLYSHLGEAFLGNCTINKCRCMVFGQRFVWVTDCYALKLILSYDGQNPEILHLQIRFMCWDMVIKHRNDVCLTDANYFSHLGADLCFDPLLKKKVQEVDSIHRRSLTPTKLPIAPMNQPYFHGPHLNMPHKWEQHPSAPHPPDSGELAAITTTGLQHLSNWPVTFETAAPANAICNVMPCCLYNLDITSAASMLAHFDWAVYSFNKDTSCLL